MTTEKPNKAKKKAPAAKPKKAEKKATPAIRIPVDSKHYVNNKDFLVALIQHRKGVRKAVREKTLKPQVPEYIGDCFIRIANHLAFKSNFINYTYRDDMILDAIENCLIYMDNFDPKKSSNPFAYFTQIAYYAFVRRIQREKRLQHTKNKYIETLDLDSVIRQAHDEGEYNNAFVDYLKKEADSANKELQDAKLGHKAPTRKPKYLQKLDLDLLIIDESEHIDSGILDGLIMQGDENT